MFLFLLCVYLFLYVVLVVVGALKSISTCASFRETNEAFLCSVHSLSLNPPSPPQAYCSAASFAALPFLSFPFLSYSAVVLYVIRIYSGTCPRSAFPLLYHL